MSHLVICHVTDDAMLARDLAAGLTASGYTPRLESPDDGLAPPPSATATASQPAAVLVIISTASLLHREIDQVVEQLITSGQSWAPVLSGVSAWELELRRPAWVAALSQRPLLEVWYGQVAAALPTLIARLDDLGVRGDGPRAPRRQGPPAPTGSSPSSLPPPSTILPPLPPELTPTSGAADWLTPAPIDTGPLSSSRTGESPTAPGEQIGSPSPTESVAHGPDRGAVSSASSESFLSRAEPAPVPGLDATSPPSRRKDEADETDETDEVPASPSALVVQMPPLPPRERLAAFRAERAAAAAAAPPSTPRQRPRSAPVSPPAAPASAPTPQGQQRRRGCIGCLVTSGVILGVITAAVVGLILLVATEDSPARRADPEVSVATAAVVVTEPTVAAADLASPTVVPTAAPTRAATRTPAPTRPPATAPAGATLTDTFEAPDAGLLPRESASPAQYRLGYDQGEYVIAVVDPTWDRLPVARLEENFGNATLAVDVRLIGDTDNRYIALACRDQGGATGSQYRLAVNPGRGRFKLARHDQGKETALVDWQTSRVIRQGNQTNRIQLRCVGAAISASINGTTVASVRDDTYGRGQFWIGAATFSGQSGTVDARFDNLTVVRQ